MKINAAIIGSGVGLRHLEAIRNYKGSKVKIIFEFNKNIAILFKKKFPKIMITSSFKKVVEDKNINLISIASYDEFHYSQILSSIKNKKNIIIEKPMCLKPVELKKIFNILKKNKNIKIMSNLDLRTENIFRKIKKEIAKDKLFYIEADYIWGRLNKLTKGWRNKTKNYSLILGTAIHMIDLVMWLINDKPKNVTAYGNKILTKSTKFKKDSFVICNLEFSKNLLVKITANSTDNYNHMHELKVFQKDKTIIHSDKGIEITKKIRGKIQKKILKVKYPMRKNRKILIRSFIDFILKGKKPLMDFKEQFDLMNVCFALEKSLKTNKKVKVRYL